MKTSRTTGHKRNPHLVIYNPPIRTRRVMAQGRIVAVMSNDVHELKYRHYKDGENYQHPFEPGVTMVAIRSGQQHDILLTRPDGKPLWEDL